VILPEELAARIAGRTGGRGGSGSQDIHAAGVVAFLRDLLRRLRGQETVVRDGGSNHEGPLVREWPGRHPGCTWSGSRALPPTTNRSIRSYPNHGLMADLVPRRMRHPGQVVRAGRRAAVPEHGGDGRERALAAAAGHGHL
jgi:hypothetical protein